MKKIIIFSILFVFLVIPVFSLTGEIVYLEGAVDIKPAGGELEWADFGTAIGEGDSIITGVDGYCEVELEGGSTITIQEDTVFSFNRGDVGGGETGNVFNCAMGQISYKFSGLTDEPVITTPSAVCGIRGTSFTVTTGADGSSLFIVSEGEVEVESMGKRVALTLDEAVEIIAGKTPGEKYPVLSGSIDYAEWLNRIEEEALADPAETVESLMSRLNYYISEMDRYHALWLRGMEERDIVLEKVKKLQAEEKTAEAEDLNKNTLIPLQTETAAYSINVRYFALSALSLRRYTMGGLYVKLRTANFKESSSEFDDFLEALDSFLSYYESICEEPFLVEADI